MTKNTTANHNSIEAINLDVGDWPAEEAHRKRTRSPRRCPSIRELKERLHHVLQHKLFHLTVVGLAGLDGVFLIVILFLEIERLQSADAEIARMFEETKFVFECTSLAVLTTFILELPVKLWVFGVQFYLTSCVETVDALICLISFALDVYVIVLTVAHRGEADTRLEENHTRTSNSSVCLEPDKAASVPIAEAAGLLILFRLWRIVRIINAIIVSVSLTHEQKMADLKQERDVAKARVRQLEELLASNQLQIPAAIQDSG